MPHTITRLLADWSAGDEQARIQVFQLFYDELLHLARAQRRIGPAPQTMNTTALVHELYEKLALASRVQAADRAHFASLAARIFRQILVDHARARKRLKRGGGAQPATLEEFDALLPPIDAQLDDILSVDQALDGLEARNARQAKVVELRYFLGLSVAEIAELLGVSTRTVDRDWMAARAWLLYVLQPPL